MHSTLEGDDVNVLFMQKDVVETIKNATVVLYTTEKYGFILYFCFTLYIGFIIYHSMSSCRAQSLLRRIYTYGAMRCAY